MMRKNTRRMKVAALLATGAMILQFGGCLGAIWTQAGIGFGRALGALPAEVVSDAFIAPLLDDLLGGGDGG